MNNDEQGNKKHDGSNNGGVGWQGGEDYTIKRGSSGAPVLDSSGNQQKTETDGE